ncbi:MAG: type III pantothenate kinase, partial [bacterium]|nr:type III pantothenate kinase [bacterium]
AATAVAALRALARHGPPSAIVIGSVVPDVTALVQAAARSLYPRVKIVVPGYRDFTRRMLVEVRPRIEPGVDRLANALALRELHGLPACAIDVGTAITLEVVDRRGAFVGGAILPGVALQYAALAQGTAQVRVARGRNGGMGDWSLVNGHWSLAEARAMNEACRGVMPGRDTAGALAFGIERGVQWALAGLVQDVACALGEPLRGVVVTGGGGGGSGKKIPQPSRRMAGRRKRRQGDCSGNGGAEPLCAWLCAQGVAATTDRLLTLRGLMLIADKS